MLGRIENEARQRSGFLQVVVAQRKQREEHFAVAVRDAVSHNTAAGIQKIKADAHKGISVCISFDNLQAALRKAVGHGLLHDLPVGGNGDRIPGGVRYISGKRACLRIIIITEGQIRESHNAGAVCTLCGERLTIAVVKRKADA